MATVPAIRRPRRICRALLIASLPTALVIAFPFALATWQIRDNAAHRQSFDPDLAARLVSRLKNFAAVDPDWWKREEATNVLSVLGKRAAALKPDLDRVIPATLEERQQLEKLRNLIK